GGQVGDAVCRVAEALELPGLLRDGVSGLDGGVPIGAAVGGVALRAGAVGLRAAGVVRAGGEVHVIVAGAARRGGRLRVPHVGLHRLRGRDGPLVAVLSVADVLRGSHGAEVVQRIRVADYLV